MLYALKIATRYLTASKAQTALLVLGVAVGVFIFIFMSALIGGLAEFILSRTVGDISHVTIEAEATDPAVLISPQGHVLAVVERGRTRTATLTEAETFLPLIAAVPGVTAVSPQITGAGFLTRGAQVSQVSVTGVEPGLVWVEQGLVSLWAEERTRVMELEEKLDLERGLDQFLREGYKKYLKI